MPNHNPPECLRYSAGYLSRTRFLALYAYRSYAFLNQANNHSKIFLVKHLQSDRLNQSMLR